MKIPQQLTKNFMKMSWHNKIIGIFLFPTVFVILIYWKFKGEL